MQLEKNKKNHHKLCQKRQETHLISEKPMAHPGYFTDPGWLYPLGADPEIWVQGNLLLKAPR